MAKKKEKGVSMTAFAALTTYSDLLSLLLTLFVLLYAISEPKRPKLAATLAAIKQHMQRLPPAPPPRPAIKPQRTTQAELSILRRGPPGKRSEVATMADGHRQKLVIGGEEFFRPGSAELSARAKRVIQNDIAPDLRGFNNIVEITGHTDKAAGETDDTWDLGYSRARSVMRFLADDCGIPENRFRLKSSGEYDPREADNAAANRRVEIIMTDALVRQPEKAEAPPAAGK